MTCPGCGSTGSSIQRAFDEETPCPQCGLSSSAADEILTVRSTVANAELKERLAAEIKRRGEAEVRAVRAEYRLREIREALDAPDPDWITGTEDFRQ